MKDTQYPCVEAEPIPKYNTAFCVDRASYQPECLTRKTLPKKLSCVVNLFPRSTFAATFGAH